MRQSTNTDTLSKAFGDTFVDTRSYKQIVLERLRKAIVSGALPAGTPLPQDKIAAEFSVSRMPVREALLQLQAEGLIEFPRHRVAVVSGLVLEDISEIFDIRGMVETSAVRIGVPKLADADIEALETVYELMLQRKCGLSEWIDLNRRFHAITYEASGRRHTCHIIGEVQAKLDRYLNFYFGTLENFDRANGEHAEILDACRVRDGDRAAEITCRHISYTAGAILAHIEEHRGETGFE